MARLDFSGGSSSMPKNVSPSAESGSGDDAFIDVRGVTVTYGERTAVDDVSFQVPKGQQLSLLGPSGCGKTTLLRCIAGFETPDAGEISVAGKVLFSDRKGVDVPVEKRRLSMMFQSYAIWPHMTVAENVGYALKVRRTPRSAARERVMQLLSMVGMTEYVDAPSTELSGGQQQRVALARSYAHLPHALLLDEPLSNLDARLREKMREDLATMQRELGVTTVYVTHDQEEAMSLSNRVLVLRDGRILQDSSPLEVYNRPRNAFVADFIGAANIVSGELTVTNSGVYLRVGDADVRCGAQPHDLSTTTGRQEAAIRTVYPRLSRGTRVDATNTWNARIIERTFLGDSIVFRVAWPGGRDLRVRTLPTNDFEVDEAVLVEIPPEFVVVLEDS